jgi:hypothetical protein
MQAQGVGGSEVIAPNLSQSGTRRRWVVGITPRPFYPQESPGIHCTESWMELGAGLHSAENLAVTGFRSPNHPARRD